jgi:tetratricopeptide (TPR) repeat protein
VLCFDCHRETQISGGFDRKLDSEQVSLYRDDWIQLVAGARAPASAGDEGTPPPRDELADIELATSLAEVHREQEDWLELAVLYASLGNEDLRDKYIEKALAENADRGAAFYLRAMQGRLDLIPPKEIEKGLSDLKKRNAVPALARRYWDLGRYPESAAYYAQTIFKALERNNPFTAAYYLREASAQGLITALYIAALQKAADEDDLWWQIRPLEDLGWQSELEDLVLQHEDDFEDRDDLSRSKKLHIRQILARAKGDKRGFQEAAIDAAKDSSEED